MLRTWDQTNPEWRTTHSPYLHWNSSLLHKADPIGDLIQLHRKLCMLDGWASNMPAKACCECVQAFWGCLTTSMCLFYSSLPSVYLSGKPWSPHCTGSSSCGDFRVFWHRTMKKTMKKRWRPPRRRENCSHLIPYLKMANVSQAFPSRCYHRCKNWTWYSARKVLEDAIHTSDL